MTRAQLIARLRAAAGPDRELDGEIWRITNGWAVDAGACFNDGDGGVWHRRDPEGDFAFEAPPYFTGSIDAAMTLVRPEWPLNCGRDIRVGAPGNYAQVFGKPFGERDAFGTHNIPIAICIACLEVEEGDAS